jgi:predicted nuclease with RNAse H fold
MTRVASRELRVTCVRSQAEHSLRQDGAVGGSLTLGIDLSSQPNGTAACSLAWSGDGARIETLELGLTDKELVCLARPVTKVGIDVPLGWPRRFAEAVWAHSSGDGWPSDYDHSAQRDEMRLRATDRWVAARYGQHPLSVAADKIALPAMRAAWLVPRMHDGPVDLTGAGTVVEVYPALALRIWGFAHQRYKGTAGSQVRTALVGDLTAHAPWLDVAAFRPMLEMSDDCLDALVAAVVARAAELGCCEQIPPDCLADARREGWIAAPRSGSLSADLVLS